MEKPSFIDQKSRSTRSHQPYDARTKFQSLSLFDQKAISQIILKNEPKKLISPVDQNEKQLVIDEENGNDIRNIELREAHSNLTNLRKKCDELQSMAFKKEQNIQKMRIEIEQLILTEMTIKQKTQNIDQRYDQLINQYDLTKIKQEEALSNKKVYLHMLDRMKKDQLSHKLQIVTQESDLHSKDQLLQNIKVQFTQKKQFQIQSKFVLEDLMNTFEDEHKKREIKLVQFKNQLKEKQKAEEKKEIQQLKQQKIAELAQKETQNTYEKKMERLMKKYSVIEQGFQKIKATTGISDTNEIVKKFLNREQAYGHVLISIAEYERKIEELKQTKEEKMEIIDALTQELVPLENEFQNINKKQKQSIELQYFKDLTQFMSKFKKSKISNEKLYNWTMKMLNKLEKNFSHGSHSRSSNYVDLYSNGNTVEAFKRLTEIIEKSQKDIKHDVGKYKQLDLSKQLLDETMSDDDYLKRNVRVRPTEKQKDKLQQTETELDYLGDSYLVNKSNNTDKFNTQGDTKEDESEDEQSSNMEEMFEKLREENKKQFLKPIQAKQEIHHVGKSKNKKSQSEFA